MAALTEGAYMIISVQSGKAIDVKGAEDRSGVNVQIYTPNKSDAQIWYLTRPEGEANRWQIDCSLSVRVMGAADPDSQGVRNVIQQDWKNDKTKQRWQITDTGETYTYSGTSYSTYRINWYGDLSLGLDVEHYGTHDGANIALHGVGPGATANQRWIFVPMVTLSETGYYKISQPWSSGLVLGIESGSTSHGANCVLEANDPSKDSQTFLAQRDASSGAYYFKPTHSNNMALDVWGGAAALPNNPYVKQGNYKAGQGNQLWFMVMLQGSAGVVHINNTMYPIYEVRTVAGSNYNLSTYKAGKVSDKKLYVHPRMDIQGNAAQHFVFIPSEGVDRSMDQPGSVSPNRFYRDGLGSVTISGMKFSSKYKEFQARYRIVSYSDIFRTSKTVGDWKNLLNDSTARNGWGDVNGSTFSVTTSGTSVSIPSECNKAVTLTESIPAVDIEIEIRPLAKTSGVSVGKAHGPSRVTTIAIDANPSVTVQSIAPRIVDGKLGLQTTVVCSPSQEISFLKARLLNDSGEPICDFSTSSNRTSFYPFEDMSSVPENGDSVQVEYSLITSGGNTVSGKAPTTVSYASMGFDYTMTYTSDDSELAILDLETVHNYDFCFVANQKLDKIRLSECPKYGSKFVIAPSLNMDVDVFLFGSANGTSWGMKKLSCRIDSHLFVWNWSYDKSDLPYGVSASVIVNTEKPPQQTRQYNSDVKFESAIGRRYNAAFSSKTLTADLGVSGIIIDEGANYVASGPLPKNAMVQDIRALMSLSGLGIYPIYRTPYGDYSQVGITSVDISKNDLNMCNAIVSQQAVKD